MRVFLNLRSVDQHIPNMRPTSASPMSKKMKSQISDQVIIPWTYVFLRGWCCIGAFASDLRALLGRHYAESHFRAFAANVRTVLSTASTQMMTNDKLTPELFCGN